MLVVHQLIEVSCLGSSKQLQHDDMLRPQEVCLVQSSDTSKSRRCHDLASCVSRTKAPMGPRHGGRGPIGDV